MARDAVGRMSSDGPLRPAPTIPSLNALSTKLIRLPFLPSCFPYQSFLVPRSSSLLTAESALLKDDLPLASQPHTDHHTAVVLLEGLAFKTPAALPPMPDQAGVGLSSRMMTSVRRRGPVRSPVIG